eukprot:CAMPEP_0116937804 /NCGR_PEP_ID=MMETSP0467-20121206/31716_1 /TAXON_ID=283647 /ORGANISM="Mesodinium pulex, Strain SPMC105" /LENGTH=162 /DNA_ID=CAMNT_0004619677 /DNA_START=909 /DNA_END=1397 /DNA_ORIENTATION=+
MATGSVCRSATKSALSERSMMEHWGDTNILLVWLEMLIRSTLSSDDLVTVSDVVTSRVALTVTLATLNPMPRLKSLEILLTQDFTLSYTVFTAATWFIGWVSTQLSMLAGNVLKIGFLMDVVMSPYRLVVGVYTPHPSTLKFSDVAAFIKVPIFSDLFGVTF